MKRLIPASILLILVIVSYIISLNYVTKICEETSRLIDQTVISYKQNNTAEKESEKIREYWDKKEKILSLFVNHSHIDDIEEAISTLNVYAKLTENDQFFEYADKVNILLHQLTEDSKVTVHSIF